ncbi:unnamed protein product [Cuscuta campestris]|uniref:NAC domain-containing protein n=2 Tax=Cuscuta sect. Cleistogrammica TaxID=1824901 RepID=A0A484LFM7_9ASTE|nr:hypothetical protein DM860_000317 [Cuscuta australis]VFQ74828.1 unnamed protein product [Cuscuta campestris]
MVAKNRHELPPGFRFHPTDEELIMFYLRNQTTSKHCPGSIIPEVDVYKFDPWELPERAEVGENEWYFFTPRDRKYPNGVRPNRAAVSGYWKATGTDKAIYSGSKYVGVKKALVFYQGRPPKGTKTDWIMHEYRLINESKPQPPKQDGRSMRLDDWVLCRIYKKKRMVNNDKGIEMKVEVVETQTQVVPNSEVVNNNIITSGPQGLMLPRPCSLTHLWELDYYYGCSSSFPQLFMNDNSYSHHADYDHEIPCMSNGGNVAFALGQSQTLQQYYSQGSNNISNNNSNQPVHVCVDHVTFQY